MRTRVCAACADPLPPPSGAQFSGELQNYIDIDIDVSYGSGVAYPTMLAGKTDDNVVRMEGIDYHAVDRMEVNTGALVDIVNVRGSSGMIGAGL
jgi:hypothetical protein